MYFFNVTRRNISDFFQVIKTGSDGLPGKPSPDIYLAAAEQLQVEPKHCLVFEDVINGIHAGKNAGMRVCAVEDAYSALHRKEKKKLADYYIEDYYGIFNERLSAHKQAGYAGKKY